MDILCRVLAAAMVPLLAPLAVAQAAYPDRPIRLILPVPAGTGPDAAARTLTPGLTSVLGEQIVVDNRGGASGAIGCELAARATPDGYTLLIGASGYMTILPHVRKILTYDTLKDFAPVGGIVTVSQLLIAPSKVPFTTIKELIAFAKANPGKLNYASAGVGAPGHLGMELFKNMAGVDIVHVPYKGQDLAMNDVLGGRMDLTFNSILSALPQIKAGRVRVLGISGSERLPALPGVPTISEAGVPGFATAQWYGVFAPVKTPRSIIVRLNEALAKVLQMPDVKSRFEAQSATVVRSSPEEFAAFFRREYEKNGKAAKLAGLEAK